jgi:hypothetical protein
VGAVSSSPSRESKKIEVEGPKREKTGKGKKKAKEKKMEKQENGKRSDIQIFFSFSLLVEIGGFIGERSDCVILHDEGLLSKINKTNSTRSA